MPVLVPPATAGPFQLYRDSNLLNPVSQENLTAALALGHIANSDYFERNLYPNGSYETDDVTNVTVGANLAKTTSGEWSSSGVRSLKVTPTATTVPTISSPTSLIIPTRPGLRDFYLSMVVLNGTPTPDTTKTFRLNFTLGDITITTEQIAIPNGQSYKFELFGRLSSFGPTTTVSNSLGSFYASLLSWQLQGFSTHATSHPFYVDDIRLASSPNPIDPPRYPQRVLYRGQATKLWVRNGGAVNYSNLRAILLSEDPNVNKPWIEVTPNPDIVPWTSAYQKAVTFRTAPLIPNDNTSFWVRPVADISHPLGKENLALIVSGDAP